MLVDAIVRSWKQARESLITELEQIPADKFDFRATDETRTVAEIVHHALTAQKVFVTELCQSGKALDRQQVFGAVKQYGEEIGKITEKEALITRLKEQMKWAEDTVSAFGDDGLSEQTTRMDGAIATRFEIMNFMIGHEMYHWGQVSVYERLLGLEPALTQRFKKVVASMEQQK